MSDRLQMNPMTAAELAVYIPYVLEAYIDDRVTHGGENRRDAEEVAAKQFAADFPTGKPAADHYLFTGRDAVTGEHTGVLWLFERKSAAGTSVFIYDIEVDQGRRGKGWGRELMQYAERWAARRGAFEIALNVFGGNSVARDLYTSLGYHERSVGMAKSLMP